MTTPVAVADANAANVLVLETMNGMPTADLVAMFNKNAEAGGLKQVKKFASREVAIRRLAALLASLNDGAAEKAADELTEAEAKAPAEAVETETDPKAKAEAAHKGYRREPSLELKNAKPGTKAARGAALLTRKIGVSLDELQTQLGLRGRAAAQTYLSFDIPRATGLGWERKTVDGERRYYALGREGGADGAVVSYATE